MISNFLLTKVTLSLDAVCLEYIVEQETLAFLDPRNWILGHRDIDLSIFPGPLAAYGINNRVVLQMH